MSTGSHTVKKQLAFLKYHPQRSCSNCILCGTSAIHYTHFGALGRDEKKFIAQHLGKAHSAEAKRYHLQEGYNPK